MRLVCLICKAGKVKYPVLGFASKTSETIVTGYEYIDCPVCGGRGIILTKSAGPEITDGVITYGNN